ncbi:MAG: protein BatD [Candidatus Cloacimonetes bacterium]|nr:protein BatD [Candidatus Cloacimonadota bacterium]
MKTRLLILLIVLFSFHILSSALEVEAYVNKTKIGLNDILVLTIEISADKISDPELPDVSQIKGFNYRGRTSSTRESVSIINGKVERTSTISYKYSLQPQKTGRFLIPPLTVKIGSQQQTTKPIQITVVSGSTDPQPPTSQDLNRNNQNDSGDIGDNLFIEATVNKWDVYRDEPVKVDYTLYTRYDIRNMSMEELNFSGFWKEDINVADKIQFHRVNRNGIIYNAMLLRSIALYPQSSGRIPLPQQELELELRTQSYSLFNLGSSQAYTARSQTAFLNVSDIPEEGRPANYTNAVGQFTISGKISDTELRTGDSFTYTMEISGRGNLSHLDPPVLEDVNYLRFFDPEITTELNEDKVSGKKVIKYLAIAQEKGNFVIPAVEFTYFDTQNGKFRTISTPLFNLTIAEGNQAYIPTGTAQSLVEMEGRDIGFIIRDPELTDYNLLLNRFWYWMIWLLISMTIPVALIYSREMQKLSGDSDYLRQKRATKIFRKYIKQAASLAEKRDIRFYSTSHSGLCNYLADKMKVNRGISTVELLAKLKLSSLEETIADKIEKYLQDCDQARFMPGGFSPDRVNDDYERLRQIILILSKAKI